MIGEVWTLACRCMWAALNHTGPPGCEVAAQCPCILQEVIHCDELLRLLLVGQLNLGVSQAVLHPCRMS